MTPYNYDRCEHCTAEVTRRKHIPALHDSYAWARLAMEHDSGCSFVVTRNFRAHLEPDDEGGSFWWLMNDATDETICKVSP